MPRLYFYKLTVDDGGAPCVQDGLLSLAICKPMIRTTAQPGDFIFGFAANSLYLDNRLIYLALVTSKVYDYYEADQYLGRGDCIYKRYEGRFSWRSGARYHGRFRDLEHDLGRGPDYSRACVLLSTDFRYYGDNGPAEYKTRYPLINDAVERLGQGHRIHHKELLRQQLLELKGEVWRATPRGYIGQTTSGPRPGVSHRSKSCEVV